jgi:Carboxypeptidase regulatory-like domain
MKRGAWRVVLVAVLVVGAWLLVAAQAGAFGTTHDQGDEHEKITRAALKCKSQSELEANECFAPQSLDELAGRPGDLGAVGNPDIYFALEPRQHCDNADFLSAKITSYYPQSEAEAHNKLQECLFFAGDRFGQGVIEAHQISKEPKQGVIPDGGCELSLPSPADVAKCKALARFGAVLHATEDFYSHSNWVDRAAPSPEGPDNPPGLGVTQPSYLLDFVTALPVTATGAALPIAAIPHELTTGCFTLSEHFGLGGLNNKLPFTGCTGRVTHFFLTKDEPTTVRSQVGGNNFIRAFIVAKEDAKRQWKSFRQKLEDEYGKRDGRFIACALTHDALLECLELKYSAKVKVHEATGGLVWDSGPGKFRCCLIYPPGVVLHVAGAWTLKMHARVKPGSDSAAFIASGKVDEQGSFAGRGTLHSVYYCGPGYEPGIPGNDVYPTATVRQTGYFSEALTGEIELPPPSTDLSDITLSTSGGPGGEEFRALVAPLPPGPDYCWFGGGLGTSTFVQEAIAHARSALGMGKITDWKVDGRGGVQRDLSWSNGFTGGGEEVSEHFELDPIEESGGVSQDALSAAEPTAAGVLNRRGDASVATLPRPTTRAAANAASQPGGQISGTVTDASTHAPLEGAVVTVFDTAGTYLAQTSTDASGKYTTAVIPAGSYKIGFGGPFLANYAPQFYNEKPSLDSAAPVYVASGQTVSGLDAALKPGGRVSGTVTDASQHTPIENVEVLVLDGEGNSVGSARTDASGGYTVAGLATGAYEVEFNAESFGHYRPAISFYNRKQSIGSADAVNVTEGNTVNGIDATLQPGGSLTGALTDASTHTALQGVVTVYDSAGKVVAAADTNVSGIYTAEDLASGSYRLDFTPSAGNFLSQFYREKSSLAAADPVSVSAGQTLSGVDAALQSGGQVSGIVTDASTHASVPEVQVTAYDSKGNYTASTQTRADGTYTLSALATGSYKVEFFASLAGFLTEYYSGQSSFYSAYPISVTAGRTVSGVDAALRAGGQLSGNVTNASTGTGLQEVMVTAYHDGSPVTWGSTDASGKYTLRGLGTGTYEVGFDAGALVGAYVPSTQFYRGSPSVELADPVSVTAGQDVQGINAAFAPSGELTGTVRDASTHAALPGVAVTVYDAAGNFVQSTRTDESGAYRLNGLATGAYRVEFDASSLGNYLPQFYNGKASLDSADAVNVVAGQTLSGIDAGLEAGGQVSGTVTAASTHLPVEGVNVSVFAAGSRRPVGSRVTDASGKYTVSGLATGSYKVGFSAPSLNYLPQFYNGRASLQSADEVSVTAGNTTDGLDATLEPGGQVSGTVTNAATHAGVPGVQVTVFSENGFASAVTDGSGDYTVAGLDSGSYKVEFDGSALNYGRQFYKAQLSAQSANEVSVTAGQTLGGVDAALQPAGEIVGIVTDASTHAPVEAVEVTVYDSEGNVVEGSVTGVKGKYRVVGLAAGSYRVGFEAGSGYRAQFYNGRGSLASADAVNVMSGETAGGIDAALQPSGQVSGTVTDASTGAALEQVGVTVYNGEGNAVGSGTTDASGKYAVTGLAAGSYKVEFDGRSLNYLSQFYNDRASLESADAISLAAGQTVGGVDAALQSGGRVSGTVSNASTHAGVEGVEVTVYDSSNRPVGMTTTDARGNYTVPQLVGGAYRVGFEVEGNYLAQYYSGETSLNTANTITVGLGQSVSGVDAVLQPGGQLRGSVTDASTHAAVPGAGVTVYDTAGDVVSSAVTATGGEYTVSGLATGSYRVEFDAGRAGNYLSQAYSEKASIDVGDMVSVTAGQAVTGVDAALRSGGEVSGTVTNASTHAPLQHVLVSVYDSEGNAVGSDTTDASGNYAVSGLAPESYRIGFEAGAKGNYVAQFYSGKASLESADPISVAAGQSLSGIDVALQPGGQMSGTVTEASTGAALEQVGVTVYDGKGSSVGSGITDASGSYTVSRLPPGSYRVGFDPPSSDNYLPQFYNGKMSLESADPVVVTAGHTANGIDAALQPGGQLSGSVTDAAMHAGLENVHVTVYDASDARVAAVSTNASGKYTVPRLVAGSYEVQFEAGTAGEYVTQFYNAKDSLESAGAVKVAAGQTIVGVDAALQLGGQVSGTVSDAATHAAVEGVKVTVYDGGGNSVGVGVTDASGKYTVAGLAAGSYQVEFATASLTYLPQFYSGKGSLESADPISVAAGQSVSGIDAMLQPGGQVSGTVTDAATHAGVPGVRVTVYDANEIGIGVASTDASGNYTVSRLTAGSYRVGFAAAGAAGNYVKQFYNGRASLGSGETVSVASGQTTGGVDAALQAGGQMSGTVTDAATDAGIESVHVSVYDATGNLIASAVTGAGGRYVVSGLATGSDKVAFDQAGSYAPQAYSGKEFIGVGDPVNVTAGQAVTGIDAALQAGGQVSGTVTDGSTHAGIEEVAVYVYDSSGNAVGKATTDASGSYTVTGLPTGSDTVLFDPDALSAALPQLYDARGLVDTPDRVKVTAGQSLKGVDAVLAPGGQLSGSVSDAATHGGIQNAQVKLYDSGGNLAGSATTGASGNYTISLLPPGSYKVEFSAGLGDFYATQYYNGKASLSEAEAVAVEVGKTKSDINAAMSSAATAPVNTGLPKISGTLALGETLSCASGSWTGSPPPTFTYRWLREGGAITGAVTSSYKVQPADQGYGIECEVTASNSSGENSAKSTAVQIPPALAKPVVTEQPLSASVTTGQPAVFSAAASGNPAPTVQWQLSKGGGAFVGVSGATSGILTIPSTETTESGDSYRAVFTNSQGAAISEPATLTVNPVLAEPSRGGGGGSAGGGSGTATTGGSTLTGEPGLHAAFKLTVTSGATLTVSRHGKLRVSVACATGPCIGKLALTVTEKTGTAKKGSKPKTRTVVIATVAFSLTAGASKTITAAVNSTGLKLLKAAHGHLAAKLVITGTSSGASVNEARDVSLKAAKGKR